MSPEELRRGALEALGEHADERARDALSRATIAVSEGLAGPVGFAGRRVTLGVDAATLGSLRAAPAVVDAICAAVARTIAVATAESLIDLVLRWDVGRRPSVTAYRDAPPATKQLTLHDALIDYLTAARDQELAHALADAEVDARDPAEVWFRLPRPAHDALRADPHAMARLTTAVQDLLAHPDARVRVRPPRA
jgi:hypothetical protein